MTTSQFIKQYLGDITLYRLSKLTGIYIAGLDGYIKGTSEPSISRFIKIVNALNVPEKAILEFIKKEQ
jgi:hypothetical protein